MHTFSKLFYQDLGLVYLMDRTLTRVYAARVYTKGRFQAVKLMNVVENG